MTPDRWCSATKASSSAPGPRLRVLGSRGAYVVEGVDGQEEALRAGSGPDRPGFGVEPPERWGQLRHGDEPIAVPSEPGRWGHFYPALGACLRGNGPPPVTVTEAVAGLAVLDDARASAESGAVISLTRGGGRPGHG